MAGEDYLAQTGPTVNFGIFQNSYKENDSQPDVVGEFIVTDTLIKQIVALRKARKPAVLGVAGWRKQTHNGDAYISCSLKVDAYKTGKRYDVDKSEIQAIMQQAGGEAPRQAAPAVPPSPASDPFFGSAPAKPAASNDPFADAPPVRGGGGGAPLSEPDDDLPFAPLPNL